MNIEKLSADCKAAKQNALKSSKNVDDDGTCNLDATFLRLPKGVRSRTVTGAIQAAGLNATATRWLGRGIMISPPGAGQANRRYTSNNALYETLRTCGWPVTPYYQMD